MPIHMLVDGIVTPTRMKPCAGAEAFVHAARQLHPRGVDQIQVGQPSKPGVIMTTSKNGKTAILIGRLLPAVQKIDVQASSDAQLPRGALKPAVRSTPG